MGSFVIITNNPFVVKKYSQISVYFEKNVLEIYILIRDMVHKGAKILSHPLSGSIKPWETPYKSVLVSKRQGTLDFESLKLIEGAIGILKNRKVGEYVYPQGVLEDFGIIDMDLINSALDSTYQV